MIEVNEPFKSYSDIRGEWEKRKISLFGVARSVISQLSFGQDLTSIGLPSIFLQPYSLLELSATRKLGYFNQNLMTFNEVNSDLDRLFLVLRWFFAYISEEKVFIIVGDLIIFFFSLIKNLIILSLVKLMYVKFNRKSLETLNFMRNKLAIILLLLLLL
jgi:hypothetical protein